VLALSVAAACTAFGIRKADYHPQIQASEFKPVIDNPYYPLVPGTVLKYEENDNGEIKEDTVTVTNETKTIMGVTCVVVHDVVTMNGRVAEDTYDWVAQGSDGAVWYFGEDTKEISAGGLVSTLGSWESGKGGGQPGILMPANPTPGGQPYRQEYGPGAAEDMGQIVAVNETVTVPAGTFTGCVKTKEWSLLEAGHEFKWYAKGVGVVRERATDRSEAKLLSIHRP
jgi:hypothetical protein